MFIILNEEGQSWDGFGWTWKNTRPFLTKAAALRALHEAGEDADLCNIIEDDFSKIIEDDYALL